MSKKTVKDTLKPNNKTAPIQENFSEKPTTDKVEQKRFAIQFDLTYHGSKGKSMDDTKVTVPDMNLTVKQILQNHTRGVDGKETIRQPLYFETEVPTISDITDVYAYKEYLQQQAQRVQDFIDEETKAAEEASKAEESDKTSDAPTEE